MLATEEDPVKTDENIAPVEDTPNEEEKNNGSGTTSEHSVAKKRDSIPNLGHIIDVHNLPSFVEVADYNSDTSSNISDSIDLQDLPLEDAWFWTFDQHPLPQFIRYFYADVLQQCVDKLSLLSHIYQHIAQPRIPKNFVYRSLDTRFGYNAAFFDDWRLKTNYNDTQKFQNYLGNLINILQSVRSEICRLGTISTLTDYIINVTKMDEDETVFVKHLHCKRKLLNRLKMAIMKEKVQKLNVLEKMSEAFNKATMAMKDIEEYNKAEILYCRSHQEARYEQNSMVIEMNEKSFTDLEAKMDNDSDIQTRIHDEIMSFLEESRTDYIEEAAYWADHYDEEIDRRDQEIMHLKNRIEKQQQHRELMLMLYEDRKADIENYLEHKRKVAEALAFEKHKEQCAIVIQKWWREVMIRKKLGPYRKKKGGKGGKKGKGKKGK